MKVLIIEDEGRAARKLHDLIVDVAPKMEIVAMLETVRESIEYLAENKVDLIFSDIQLADGISFEIFQNLTVNCPIVFTTAYDQYAIKAFETKGIDYLLKPIQKERLQQAIDKFEELKPSLDIKNLMELIQKPEKNFKKRFMIKVGEKIKTITTDEISAFYSLEKGTYLLTNSGRNYVVDYSLEEVNKLLDPEVFFRINRKIIVHISGIEEIISHSNSRLKLVVPHLELEEVIVAREKVNEFKVWMGA